MKIKLFIILLFSLFCTGCHSYTELNDLSIVSVIGIDYQNDKYHLVVNVIDGSLDDKEIEKQITTFHSEQSSLEEAFHDVYLKSSKKLYLSHLDLLVLTENAVQEKFVEVIDNFLENNEYRNNFNIVLLKDTNIKEFMQENMQAEDINQLIKTNERETGFSAIRDFETILKELLIDKNSYLPTISYPNQELTLKGFTLIKNYQVYQELSLKESILLNLLQNKIQKAYLNETNILESQTLITTNKNHIAIRFLMTIQEDNRFEEKTKEDIKQFLNKFYEDDYDILKLTEKIRKNDYRYYQNTDLLLQKLKFDFTFKIKEKETYLQRGAIYETK